MKAARSLVVSTVTLLVAGAAWAEDVTNGNVYRSEVYKPVFTGSMTPGSKLHVDSPSAVQVTTKREAGDTFPAAPAKQLLAGESVTDAQEFKSGVYQPVFTGSMATGSELRFDAPSAGATSTAPSIPRGKSPAAHANEMAELFRQACLQSGGEADRVADWALGQGYIAAPVTAHRLAKRMTEQVDGLNVFTRDNSEGAPLLVFASRPMKCGVIARQPVDVARLRAQLARLAVQWSGTPAPKSVMLDDLSDVRASSDGRLIAYRFNTNGRQQTLATVSPKSASSDSAFLALQVGDAPAAR